MRWDWNWLFVDLLGKVESFVPFISTFTGDETGTKFWSIRNFIILDC